MASPAYESWIGSEASIGTEQLGTPWDYVKLGSIYLPGVCTIEDFEYGQDIDVQKKRKKEKARIRDNGLSPCSFNIKVEMTAAEWPAWLAVLPEIQPRREGGTRKPLAIEHPLPNSHGVRDIYVHKIKVESPSARAGMVIIIRVAEWFEEEVDAKPVKKVAAGPAQRPRAQLFAAGAGHRISNLGTTPTVDAASAGSNTFGQ